MNSKAQHASSEKLLSRRESELVPRNTSTDETVNISVVKSELINLTGTFVNDQSIRKLSKIPIFEPLDEDGERYLQELMRLPPIDLTETPTRYYINPHPTESMFSSGPNSVNEWWDKVDYSDSEDLGEIECPGYSRRVAPVRKRSEKPKLTEAVKNPPKDPLERTYPKTEEMRRERKIRELEEEELSRAEIISKLEKKMVSLYNLKRQYKRTLVGKGCPGAGPTKLPPLGAGVAADDNLVRQRDSLLFRIKKKKIEDEKSRKLCIERKIEIVKMLLEEQKQKEKQIKKRVNEVTQSTFAKKKKHKEESREIPLVELVQETSDDLEKTEIIDDVPSETIETPLSPTDDVPLSDQLETPAPSPKKTSKGKGDKKKKSSEASDIEDAKKKKGKKEKGKKEKGKKEKGKKEKITAEAEETPAICEPAPELPTSQMAELPLWFKNWREDKISGPNQKSKEIESKLLPEESEVTLMPRTVVFKDVAAGRTAQQTVVITNKGQGALQCRIDTIHQPEDALIQTAMSGPGKARTGQSWCLTVILDPWEGVEDGTAAVLLLCCRGEVQSRLSIAVQLLTARAEPALSTGIIRFGPQMFWSGGPFTQQLQIANQGGAGCVVRWTEVAANNSVSLAPNPDTLSQDGGCESQQQEFYSEEIALEEETEKEGDDQVASVPSEVTKKEDKIRKWSKSDVVKDILDTAFRNVFSTFRIDARQPLVLPARAQVSLAVRFVPTLSEDQGDVFAKYRFCFEGENVENEVQELVVCGKIEPSPFSLEHEAVNMQQCYTGGSVQQARLVVLSSVRHACRVTARVPRDLAAVVTVVPREAVVAADSCVSLAVRLVLGWDFLDRPCRFLQPDCGLLMFPVSVWVKDGGRQGAPPLEATVIASVAPPCPLTLAPPTVDLGTVTTMETVEAELRLTNHSPAPYSYAFVGLPQSVMMEPGGGTGGILPMETVKLRLLFSPTAQDVGVDCGRPGGEGKVNLTLRCFTAVSLASPVLKKHPQKVTPDLPLKKNGISSTYVSLANSLLSHKTGSRSGILPPSGDEKGQSENGRKVGFQENVGKTTSEESFVYVPVNNDEEEKGGGDGDKLEEEVEDDKNYVTISEIKEEVQELATDDMWDYYSTFQFEKCTKNDVKRQKSKNKTKQVKGDELSNNESVSSTNDVGKSMENTGEDEDKSTQQDIEGESNKSLKEDVKINEIVAVDDLDHDDDLENNENVDENINVDEIESLDKSLSDHSASQKDAELHEDSKDACLLPETSQRFATLSVNAYVVDPLVELSSQTVVLPPTPCTGYTIAHVYLRARPQKLCSVHDKITKFKTRFEFRSPSKDLTVEPFNGYISYNQSRKINIIFRPKLSDKDIANKALNNKVENLKWQKVQDLLNEYNKSKDAKLEKDKKAGVQFKEAVEEINATSLTNDGKIKKGKGKKSKGSVESDKTKKKNKPKGSVASDKTKKKESKGSGATVKTKKKESLKGSKLNKKSSGPLPDVVIDPSEVEVTEEDMKEAGMSALKYLEPYQDMFSVLCLLETVMGDGSRRQETLRCEVLCSVVAPTIFLNTPACVDFGPVAVGTTARLEAVVTNISFFDAFVRLSTLNPLGPFSCPVHMERPYWKNGELELPPEHILTIPICFQPTGPNKVVEAFEVTSGSTVLHLQARGSGVTPAFAFQPDREVFMVTSAPGKKADITVAISNTGEAPLRFRINLEYLKEGQNLPSPAEEQAPTAASSPKNKKEPKKEKKAKGLPEITMLNEELENCLENDYIALESVENTEPVFKLINTEDNVTVGSGETKSIIIRFTPPVIKREPEVIKSPKSPRKDSPKDKKSPKGSRQDSPKGSKSPTGSRKDSPKDSKKAKNKSIELQDALTDNTKLTKKDEKKNRSSKGKEDKTKDALSVKTEKKVDAKQKQIYAARFRVVLADTIKVKDWVMLGTKK